MNKNLVIVVLVALLAVLSLFKCEQEPRRPEVRYEVIHDTIQVITERIVEKKKAVAKLKQSKSDLPTYTVTFDSTATRDTIYVELVKCDSIVQVDSIIIASQDIIIEDQSKVIELQDTLIQAVQSDLKAEKKANRRLKKKLFFTKVGAVLCVLAVVAIAIL
jgi:hypothetical protein